jgi:hypothetical protein
MNIMHSVNISITLTDGHQELIDQICELLCARGVDIHTNLSSPISTNIIAQKIVQPNLENDDTPAPAAAHTSGYDQDPSGVSIDPSISNDAPESPALVVTPAQEQIFCRVMQLSTEHKIPIVEDPAVNCPTLCVQNLEVFEGPNVATFTYCDRSYKAPVLVQHDVMRFITDAIIQLTVNYEDRMFHVGAKLKCADECCLIVGSEFFNTTAQN